MSKIRSKDKTQRMALVGVMAALATAMYLFLPEIPLLAGHLKLDVSDLPAMVAAMISGPLAGLAIEIIKNAVHLLKTTSFGIGEIINVLVGGAMVFGISGFYRIGKKIRKSEKAIDHGAYLFSIVCTTAVTVAVGFAANLIFTGPYLKILHLDLSFKIILGYATASLLLTFVKSVLNGVLIYPIVVSLKKYIRSGAKM